MLELFQHGPRAEDPRSLFDASLRVPLVLRHPASLTGKRCLEDLVELADVPATLRDWFGLSPVAGRSLLALTDSHVERAFERRPIVARGPDGGGVRTAERHLIVRGDERLLFAPRRDPLERVDLAAEEPGTVARLLVHLRDGP